MVDCSFNKDIYDTNMEYIKNLNCHKSLWRYFVIITIQLGVLNG